MRGDVSKVTIVQATISAPQNGFKNVAIGVRSNVLPNDREHDTEGNGYAFIIPANSNCPQQKDVIIPMRESIFSNFTLNYPDVTEDNLDDFAKNLETAKCVRF